MEPRFSLNVNYIENNVVKSVSSKTSEEIQTILINDPGQSHLSIDNRIDHSSRCLYKFSETDLASEFESKKCRIYPKKEFKKLTWEQDSYEGIVIANNLHGPGFYFTQKGGQKYFYDGLFYMNKLEGYSQVFYEIGTHFQGLFRNHLRYGPGVLSYPDGSQDVGFWEGFKLIRLACVVGSGVVPSLASTQAGKTKLLCSRHMIPLDEENNEIVKELMANGNGSKELLSNLDVVLNPKIRNPNSLFFHRKFYDNHFFGGEDCTIKVFVEGDEAEKLKEQEYNKEQDDISVERIRNLRSKIQEVNENLQTFTDIKHSLLHRINQCKICCESASDIKTVTGSVLSSKFTTRSILEHSIGTTLESLDVIKGLRDADTSLNDSDSTLNVISVCSCDEAESQQGLQHLEEQLQNIIVQETFYKNIRDELQKKLDRIIPRGSSTQNVYNFKLVKVNELWAWNNEKSAIQMQRHCFRHRNSEDMVNFSVPHLIAGNRKEFGPLGKHEEICHLFLLACAKGNKAFVKDCLQNNRVHPNVADAKGNTGIFFASAHYQGDIIPVLTNFGAKLDQINDDQLTPLALCFLKYIAVKNNCSNWEKAFLPETEMCDLPDIPKWYNIRSFLSITSTSSQELPAVNSSCINKLYSQPPFSNLRIMDLFQKASVCVDHKKLGLPKSLQNASYIFDISNQSPAGKQDDEELDCAAESEMKSIYLTIITLLDFGANPNTVEVPYPALVLSLFTENPDLVKEVIKAHIDINVVIDQNLSCLHIIASLTPTEDNAHICHVLTKYGCNPNLKTSPDHWEDRRSYFTGKIPENFKIEDTGKNPLHLLCMRTDFQNYESDYFCAVAKVLLATNLDTKDTYLGHTALSLAVLSGNIKLVQYLIDSNIFNPYKPMEYGMGNILTLYALKRFDNTLSVDQRKAMLTALFEMDVNVLNSVCDTENAIVFAEDKDNFFDEFIQKQVKEPKKGTKVKAKVSTKKLEKNSPAVIAREYLRNIGRQTIIKQIQLIITEMLFEFVEEGLLENYEIPVVLASEYLTTSIVIRNLKYLFQNQKIGHDRLDQNTVKKLLEFVSSNKKIVKKASTKKLEKSISEQTRGTEEDLETLAKEFDSQIYQGTSGKYLTIPGLDDPLKYQVCFHCLRGKEKVLKSCPRCQMIQFCSVQCNKLNLKLKTQHGCNILFYDMAEEKLQEISKGVCLTELFQNVKAKCVLRWQKIREAKLAQEEAKLLEMWRTDVYGTKFLQMMPQLDQVTTKRRDKQLHWNLGLLKGLLERNFQKCPGEASFYSLENLLFKLQGKRRSEGTIRTRQSCSTRRSTLGGASTLHSAIFSFYEKILLHSEPTAEEPECKCPKKIHCTKPRPTEKPKKKHETARKFEHNLTGGHSEHFEDLVGNYTVRDHPEPAIKKLKKIPDRYQKFIEVIGTYFPDTDLKFWLLPYACYSDGQLYYKFCDNNMFKESYSFS